MKLSNTNIAEKLSSFKRKTTTENEILDQVYQILEKEATVSEAISERIKKSGNQNTNRYDFDKLESQRIFHIDHIKKICIDYRLRFLNSRYFKGKIPHTGIDEIRRLEKLHDTTLDGFKIMAPSKLFKLEDKDDPILFAPIGNGYYYLIHKWGNDLHPLRKMMVWPFKGVVNLAITTLVISYFATLLIPSGLFSKNNTPGEFWMLFFFMFKSIAAIVIFYGFALGKNFNPAIWNSKYYNT